MDSFILLRPGFRSADSEATREALEYATSRDMDIITVLDGKAMVCSDFVPCDRPKIYDIPALDVFARTLLENDERCGSRH